MLSMLGHIYVQKYMRGFLPVVIDLETSGPSPERHGILEWAAFFPDFDFEGVELKRIFHRHVRLESHHEIDPEASLVHKIPIDHPFRDAQPMSEVLSDFKRVLEQECDRHQAKRAFLVGHNPAFDMSFIQQALHLYGGDLRMHRYTLIDTASIGLLRHRETVLARLCNKEGLNFDPQEAHSALYDAWMTGKLFWSLIGKLKTQERKREFASLMDDVWL